MVYFEIFPSRGMERREIRGEKEGERGGTREREAGWGERDKCREC